MCQQFADAYIAGAAVAIVDGDRIAFSSGYGRADLGRQVAVNPARTPFRIGSISKVFTWTAVMQLAERGLSLDADINDYLPVTIPATFPRAITLRNLMAHSAGFEHNIAGIGLARAGEPAPSLAETIARHIPARVRAPAATFDQGADAAYSNWVGALAGYAVEQRSREPFDDYVDRHIFAPLAMRHSSFREPLPRSLEALASAGYRPDEGYPVCLEPSVHGLAPASSASASAEDMARFMMAHLNEGGALLAPATARLMQRRAFSPHRHLAGGAGGFNERYVNGRRLLWHGGVTSCFYAELYLFPEERIGLFVVYNTYPLWQHKAALAKTFMDRYFPATLPDLQPSPDDAAALAPYAGYYRTTSRAHDTWEKVFDLTSAIHLSVGTDGFFMAPMSAGSERLTRWVRVRQAPAVLRRADGEDTIAFTHAGGETYLLGPWPFAPLVKLRGLSNPELNAWLIGLCSLGFLLPILAFPFRAMRPHWRPYRRIGCLAAAAGAVNLGILAALTLVLHRDTIELMIALPWPLWVAMGLSLVSGLLSIAMTLALARGWRNPAWTANARAGFTVLVLPSLAFVGWLWHWNLLGFQLG